MLKIQVQLKKYQWNPLQLNRAGPLALLGALTVNMIQALTSPAHAAPSCTLSPLLIPSENFSISTSSTYPDLMISSDGNIGIGTNNPNAQFHVRGVDNSGTNLTNALHVKNSNGDSLLRVSTTTNNPAQEGDISMGLSTSTQRLTITAQSVSMSQLTMNGPLQLDGNLTLQQASLQVPIQVGAGASPTDNVSPANVPPLAVAASLNQSANQPAQAAIKIVSPSQSPLFRVQLDGKVGINQAKPSEILDIVGGLSFTGNYIRFTPQPVAPPCTSTQVGLLVLSATYTLCSCTGSKWINASTGANCTWSGP